MVDDRMSYNVVVPLFIMKDLQELVKVENTRMILDCCSGQAGVKVVIRGSKWPANRIGVVSNQREFMKYTVYLTMNEIILTEVIRLYGTTMAQTNR